MPHVAKTLFADPVVYFKADKPHVAFVMKTHDDDPHMACLICYCSDSHQWFEAYNVPFGQNKGGEYFLNQGYDAPPEA